MSSFKLKFKNQTDSRSEKKIRSRKKNQSEKWKWRFIFGLCDDLQNVFQMLQYLRFRSISICRNFFVILFWFESESVTECSGCRFFLDRLHNMFMLSDMNCRCVNEFVHCAAVIQWFNLQWPSLRSFLANFFFACVFFSHLVFVWKCNWKVRWHFHWNSIFSWNFPFLNFHLNLLLYFDSFQNSLKNVENRN